MRFSCRGTFFAVVSPVCLCRSLHLDGLDAVGDCTGAMERFSHGDHQDLATPKATSIVPASEATRRTSPIYGYRRGLRT
ncbi:hypothetical protein DY000_02002935 [Brassica cretica]|uniref:Secreted protein n=1 Tax=Brassica cretica TaxID=69181 RepID=A0ABQ7CG41_BRACR|nr:hypothetical protein DY000_02002935 [Brassica cretica]